MFISTTVYIEDQVGSDGAPTPDRMFAVVTDVRRDDMGLRPGAVARYTFAEATSEPRRRAVDAASEPEFLEDGTVLLYDVSTLSETRRPIRMRYRPLTRENFGELEMSMVGWDSLNEELQTDFEIAYYFRMMLEDAILD